MRLQLIDLTGGNLRLVIRLLAQIERVLDIKGLDTVAVEIVDAAREVLVIGGRPPFSLGHRPLHQTLKVHQSFLDS